MIEREKLGASFPATPDRTGRQTRHQILGSGALPLKIQYSHNLCRFLSYCSLRYSKPTVIWLFTETLVFDEINTLQFNSISTQLISKMM